MTHELMMSIIEKIDKEFFENRDLRPLRIITVLLLLVLKTDVLKLVDVIIHGVIEILYRNHN